MSRYAKPSGHSHPARPGVAGFRWRSAATGVPAGHEGLELQRVRQVDSGLLSGSEASVLLNPAPHAEPADAHDD